jgi:hypothetical protein
MERQVTPMEAWEDFYRWISEQSKRIPKEVQQAKYDRDNAGKPIVSGKRKFRAGLGETRIRRLLEKYAPDRYQFSTTVIIKE